MALKIGPYPEPYHFVHPKDIEILDQFEDHFANTGGNPPADLLNDLNGAAGKYFASTNVVRFTLAVGVQGQLALIKRLTAAGLLTAPEKPEDV